MDNLTTGRRWTRRILPMAMAAMTLVGACQQDITRADESEAISPPSRFTAAEASRSADFVPECNDCNPWIPVDTDVHIGVGISGPTSHRTNQTCSFQAVVNTSGATAPYSYSWTGAGQSGSSEWFYPNSTGITISYQVTLTVTDALGRTGTVARIVSVGANKPLCPE